MRPASGQIAVRMKRLLILLSSLLSLAAAIVGSYYLLTPGEDPVVQLMETAGQGTAEQLEQLLREEQLDINTLDWLGRTPLFYAARFGNIANLRCLLTVGADANKPDLQGMTPLYAAAWFGHDACVEALLQVSGIDINHETVAGETAYHAAKINRHPRCVELLESKRTIDPVREALDRLAESGIDSEEAFRLYTFKAIEEDDPIMLQLLIQAGVVKPTEVFEKLGTSPLQFAEDNGSTRCAELLRQIAD